MSQAQNDVSRHLSCAPQQDIWPALASHVACKQKTRTLCATGTQPLTRGSSLHRHNERLSVSTAFDTANPPPFRSAACTLFMILELS